MLEAGQVQEVQTLQIVINGNMTRCVLNDGAIFLLDTEDLNVLDGNNWRVDKMGYIRSGHNNLLHRMILKPFKGKVVDHINGNPSDNRKNNLRIGSQKQNSYNTRLSKNNKTGFKGVSWDKYRNRYAACICVDGCTKHLGRYDTKEEAADAYDKAASFYFGHFALLNKELKEVCNETKILELGKKREQRYFRE